VKLLYPAAFDVATAKDCALMVRAAYELHDSFVQKRAWQIPTGCTDPVHLMANNLPFGFVAQLNGDTFVAIRGTEEKAEWYADFTFPQVNLGWGSVEQGFWNIYRQFQDAMKEAVRGAGGRVIVTGHSLGAALAVLATIDLTQNVGKPEMYSFAGPRVGDLRFAEQFDSLVARAYRIVNTEDIVTTVPPATVFRKASGNPVLDRMLQGLNYKHVGTQIAFTKHLGTITGNHSMDCYEAALG